MRTTDVAVVNLLNSGLPFGRAELYTFKLDEGTTLHYCEWDVDIVYGGNTYSHVGPLFKRNQSKFVRGLSMDELRLTVFPLPSNLILGTPWLSAAHLGALDGAEVALDFAFFDLAVSPTQVVVPVGVVNWFTGRVSDIPALDRMSCEMIVRSDIERLDIRLPRNLYQPGCLNTLFDSACKVNRSAYMLSGVVAVGVSPSNFAISGPAAAQPAGYYNQGTVLFTSGANAGVKRTVKNWASQTVELFNALRLQPQAGDGCTLIPGCDKTKATCTSKFNNVVNFRGMPHVPIPDSVL